MARPSPSPILITSPPALLALGSSSEDAAKTFRSATVLIGNTHYDSNDLHATPLGEMPGILLLANAIYSLLDGGVMEEPHPAVLLFLELLVVLLLAAIFTWVNLRFTLLLGVVLVALLLFSTAILLFYFGVWFDFVTPLLGPITHQFLAKHSHTNESPAGETN